MLDRLFSSVSSFLPKAKVQRLIFLALLVLGIFLRVAGLTWGIPKWDNGASIYHDEGHVLGYVLYDWKDFKENFGEYEIVRPVWMYRVLGRPLIALGDFFQLNDPATRTYEFSVLRSLNALWGIAGLIGIYALGKKLGSTATGLWALALLTVTPGHWYYSQILKGDIIVSTIFTLVLLAAIRIAEKGDRTGYVWGGVILGVGVALKATAIVAAPVVVFAHILHAWRQGKWRQLANVQSLWLLLAGLVSFSLSYPYPFIDIQRLYHLFANPSLQDFKMRFIVPWQDYMEVWQQYTLPNQPFAEMIYGRFLLWCFLPLVALMVIYAVVRFIKAREVRLLITLVLTLLFLHSLTFTPALDDRYILPSAPFAVLFPAIIITWPLWRALWQRIGAALFGAYLLVGTAAITWVIFPSFAFHSPRDAAATWIEARVLPKQIIAQPSQLSRWAVLFDRSRYRVASFVFGKEGDRHVGGLTSADFLLIQRDPWNYDHTFRYELTGLEAELSTYKKRFSEHQVFGNVPVVFGKPVPQNFATPVIDVYTTQSALVPSPLPSVSLRTIPASDRAIESIWRGMRMDDLRGRYLLTKLKVNPIETDFDSPQGIGIGLMLNRGQHLPPMPAERQEDASVVETPDGVAVFHPMVASRFRQHDYLLLAIEFAVDGRIVFYAGFDGALSPVGSGTYTDDTVNASLFALAPDTKGAFGTMQVLEAGLGSLP